MFGLRKYNYESFRRDFALKDLARTKARQMAGPQPGERAPDLEGRTLDGDKFRLKDLRGESNLVLTFGSATCPFTAASIQGLNDLYNEYRGEEVDFLFVYVREAHPGERLPAHTSYAEKVRAAETFREQEDVDIPILVDELDGAIHNKYGGLPNPSFLIDKSGRVAFRALWTRPKVLREALEELLTVQAERDTEHAVVHGGEDTSIPMVHGILHTHRALERGGRKSVRDYREQMGRGGRVSITASWMMEPIALHPARAVVGALLAGGVIFGGLLLGRRLRRERFGSLREPYTYAPRPGGEGEYAVGI